ncbi:MAG: toll/interleukin-1 receptor domain-containing protein [Oscillospiraceae bacterium]|nr:toll/interleukin-1 receptor domain-containing protein [Oscillospiraceae bacterium]
MKEIFISYSSIDLPQAETVRNVLEKNGLSCWMAPRDIPGGSNYTKEIPIAIRNCKVFVLILSDSAQNSHWVLKELDSAVNCGKVILPFMLEDCALNDEFNFLLTGAQRYSAYQKKAEAMETLIGRIRGILDAPSAAKSEQTQDIPEAAPVIEPKPAAKKAVVDLLLDAKCPACGSEDLKELKGKVKCENVTEHLTKLWIPVMAVVGLFVGFLIASFIIPFEKFELYLIFMLVGIILGAVWGANISRNKVKRSRLRHGFSSTCYRCNRCQKVFDHKTALDN